MKNSIAALSCAVLAASVLLPHSHAKEVFQNTSLTVGYTNESKEDAVFGSGTQDKKAIGYRFEHFGVHEYGDNYFFADVGTGEQIGGPKAGSFNYDTDRQTALVWNARGSLSKISGKQMEYGIIEDISLMYRGEVASYANYNANMVGPSFNLKVPGFTWFQTSFLLNRQNHSFASDDDKKAHLFWHTFAIVPFKVGGAQFTFSPVLWVNYSDGSGGREVFVEPDLWVKLGSHVDLGLRLQHHSYNNYSRNTPTLMARWNF